MKSPSDLLDRAARELAAAARNPDAGAIHDVRVAIRRLLQCLDVCGPLLPARATRKIARKVHKVLRAAGEVRDFDIAIKLLKNSGMRGAGGLARELRSDRRGAAAEFRRALHKLDNGAALKGWRLERPKNDVPRQALEYAGTILPQLAAEFFDAGEAAANPAAGYGKLHKFRVQGKKFRYTMELFASDYGPALAPRLHALRNVQKRLGDINDSITTAKLLEKYRKSHRAIAGDVVEYLERLAVKNTAAFRRYWRKTLGAREKDAWVRYFSGLTARRVA